MGWLAGWSHRKTVTITGQSGAGTDYQVNLSIGDASGGDFHLENHCTSFPNDITVTDNDQTTPLDHWVEDLTVDPISMWVEVADDLGSNVDICVYYDKSGESSVSNGRNTFIVWDDFDGGTEQWTEVDTNNRLVIDRTTDKRIEITNALGGDDSKINIDKGADIGNVVYQVKITRTTETLRSSMYLGLSDTTTASMGDTWNDGVAFGFYHSATGSAKLILAQCMDGGVGQSAISTGVTWSINTPYYCNLIRNGSTWTLNAYSDSARTNLLGSGSETYTLSNIRYVFAYTARDDFDVNSVSGYVDDVIVRKYNSPEPAYSSAGSEESAPVGAIMNQFQGANIGADLYNGALIT